MEDKSIFIEFLGDTPHVRLLDLFITWRNFSYTLTEMAEKAEMSWSTLHRIFPELLKHNILSIDREVGRAKLYKLNQKNLVVKKLIELYDVLVFKELENHQEQVKEVEV